MPTETYTLRLAQSDADLAAVRTLFEEYAAELDFELCFQDFQAELDALPGPYARPDGDILLAEVDATIIGCVAVKPLEESVCEMKRLYVRPAYRGEGIGRALAKAIVERGRTLGYERMCLDTVEPMHAAQAVYRALDFEERDPYYKNPLPDVVYMEREL